MDIKIIGKADVDRTSPAAFNRTISPHIGYRECEMLLQNLADVGYPQEKVKGFGASYGFTIDDGALEQTKHPLISARIKPKMTALKGVWNDEGFKAYKEGTLYERMTNPEKNYTFILAKDGKGETIGLVSFNAPDDKSQLRVLNFTVHRDHRTHSAEIVRTLSKEVMRYAIEHGFKDAPINAPVSNYAMDKGNNIGYFRLAQRYGVESTEKPDGAEQSLITFTPRDLNILKPLDVSQGERINLRRKYQEEHQKT